LKHLAHFWQIVTFATNVREDEPGQCWPMQAAE
jgi:hypothetical protein